MRCRPERPARREIVRAVLACVLLLAAYYLVPVEPGVDPLRRVVRSALTGLAMAGLAVLIGRMALRLLRDSPGSRPAGLLVALFGGLVASALVDYQVAVAVPGEFVRLETKTDALYFAVSTLTTVGYGDIHAAGQVGRSVVIEQQLFNVTVLTTGAAVLVNRLKAGGPHPPQRPGAQPPGPPR